MLFKNVASQKIHVYAYDSTTGAAKTGDAANITAYVSLDGTANAIDDTNPTEVDATNMPGVYVFDLAQAETNCNSFALYAKSSTSNIRIEPIIGFTTGAAVTQTGDCYARLGAPAGASHAADVAAVKGDTAAVKAKTDNLPTDPADQSAVEAAITAATSGLATAANLATVAGYIDTEITTILGYVDCLPATWVVPGTLTAGQVRTELATELGRIDVAVSSRGTGTSTHSAADVVTAMGTGTFLTAIPWNAAWDTEVQSECTDALTAAALTAAGIADAVWDELATGHIDTGKAGAQLWTVINTLSSGSAINVTTTTTIIESE